MNLEEYRVKSHTITEKSTRNAESLFNSYQQILNKNYDDLKEIVYVETVVGFVLIDRFGKQIEVIDDNYVYIHGKNNEKVYLSISTKELVNFKRDLAIGFPEPFPIDSSHIIDLFNKSDFYEDLIHVVGLDGILKKALEYKENSI